ncbi:uncharacterized protein LOC117174796 [Belonocnema kinseyi]|uniref:uncharacterized protein LOC117174796 n=1 Tax=Belonocnema kinseyi TaxID=2817044 RepID=UPI00143D49AB|nr:uncharacterized protein LOC117174796 [Belonocnema kinseyi]
MASSGGACDTRCQAFFTSVIKKENAARMKWFIKYQDRLLKDLEDPKLAHKAEDLKSLSARTKKTKKRQEKKTRVNLKEERKTSTALRPEENVDLLEIRIMRPLDSKMKNILCASGVETFTAASQYLKERYKEKPEDRFYYPECSSWSYGWRLKDHPPIPTSQFGNRSIVETSFYSRGTVLTRDPDWYKMCQTKNAKNFNDIFTY